MGFDELLPRHAFVVRGGRDAVSLQDIAHIAFSWPARLLRRVVVGPLLLLHAAVPCQDCFRLYDGRDSGQAFLDPHAVFGQRASLSVCQRDSIAELAA